MIHVIYALNSAERPVTCLCEESGHMSLTGGTDGQQHTLPDQLLRQRFFGLKKKKKKEKSLFIEAAESKQMLSIN